MKKNILISLFFIAYSLASFGQENEIPFYNKVRFYRPIRIDDSVKSDTGVFNDIKILHNGERYQIRFNESDGVFEFQTENSEVIWQGPLEDFIKVHNNSGVDIDNCLPISFSGTTTGDSIINVVLADCSDQTKSDDFIAITTLPIPNGSSGFATTRGYVHDCPTLSYDSGKVWLGTYELVDTIPAYPNSKILAGIVVKRHATQGIIYAYPSHAYKRDFTTKAYQFTSRGITAGTYYKGGYYESASADANLSQVSTTQTFGAANTAKSAHGFVVCGGSGTVNTGVVGLRVTGTSIDDEGTLTVSDADTIITDITQVALNEYYEAKKFVGTITFELIAISGSPTTYSFDFNYGYSKYDDFNNRDFYLYGLEVVGLAGADDSGFNIELLKHTNTGWTYDATAFVPGNGYIASMENDLGASNNNVSNNEYFAWKRSNIDTYIDGSTSDGILFRITTTANNTVQFMDMHVKLALDSDR
jgi:hypothetical protein